ncbi:DUF418 domain-containing protein [Undibacterium flavidum]|uniref:DUF418 domain-containing protein n=1 Tax=Undibacterium flavidum TaxID=2762297 RepID=A0ABR6Y7L5_9BURK|nr:DUF418 domain-containing protein [Undibacterium flavidum]MBC3872139.1 DUF418 domain-containing protein [Undibacterium flavidum]
MHNEIMQSDNSSAQATSVTPETSKDTLAPVAATERIAVLDVIRGFALIGIFLMNIEFFNRPVGDLGNGMPAGLSGLNWLASYAIAYFVAGKFWTIFSLLFGMGFALMLTRSQTKGRAFFQIYLRRLFALGIFGILHHVLIWPGDILYSYAIAACGLLLILFGKPLWIFAAAILLGLLSAIPSINPLGAFAVALAIYGCIALLLRSEKTLKIGGKSLPVITVAFCLLACLLLLTGLVSFAVPAMAKMRGAWVFGILCFLLGYLLARSHQPVEDRPWKIGSLLYCSLFFSMAMGGAAQYFGAGQANTSGAKADSVQTMNAAASASSPSSTSAAASIAVAASNSDAALISASIPASASISSSVASPAKSKATELADQKKKEAERLKKKEENNRLEAQILSKGTYLEALKFRAHEFAEKWAEVAIFSALINCMFLIGFWFVRSGVMANTGTHLPMFKKLAMFGLPFGIGLGVLGSLLSTAPVQGMENDPYLLAMGLLYLGNLPACLGYVSLLVLMLHSKGAFSKVAVLAPYGRMALTNYLSQSIICSAVFYNYGLGYYGMQRAHQVVFVAVVVILQVLFSHWWLSKYRYGPMEWLWRAITYWKVPAFKN